MTIQTSTTNDLAVRTVSLKERMMAFLTTILQDSRIAKGFQPVILNLVKNFMQQVSDEELARGLEDVRTKVIPWLLTGDAPKATDEDTHTQ